MSLLLNCSTFEKDVQQLKLKELVEIFLKKPLECELWMRYVCHHLIASIIEGV
jgi:hypothetical protein